MTEEDPIADLTGQHQRARSAPEAKKERLRDWLERALWSGAPNPIGPLPWPESACILAGLDPEASADADPAGWSLLPGALAFYGFNAFPRDRDGQVELHASVEEHIGRLLGLHLNTMPPANAIKAARAAGLTIPWANAAEGAGGRSAFSKAQQERRRAQLASDDKQKLIKGAGRDAFDQIRNADFAGYRKPSGGVNVAKVARELRKAIVVAAPDEPESWPDHRTLVKYAKEWLAESKSKDEGSANSESAPADV